MVGQLVSGERHPELVLATHRSQLGTRSTAALEALAKEHSFLHLLPLDLRNEDTVKVCAQQASELVGDLGLTVLVNNSATLTETSTFEDVTSAELMDHYKVNTVGPVLMTQAILPLLRKAAEQNASSPMSWCRAAVFYISSSSGSITLDELGWRMYSYKASKSALNQLGKMMSQELGLQGILTQMLCPGWVRTDMGGPSASISPEESTQGLLSVMQKIDKTRDGSFMNYRDEKLPW